MISCKEKTFIYNYIIQMNVIDNITPNEKRMHLFNVNEPTELPIEEFEKKLVAAG